MATPGTEFIPWTSDPLINATTHGYRWVLRADRTLDWAIADGRHGEFWNQPAALFQQIDSMLKTISYFAEVRFNYVGYHPTPEIAYSAGSEITISVSASLMPGGVWARAFFPTPDAPSFYAGEAGDVYLNTNSQANFLSSYAPGSAGWFVFLHEVGHAIGLKHPHDDGGTGRPTLAQIGLSGYDEDWATIMSYQDDFNWNLRLWDPITPMILDVLALQYLYGKNMSTNAGDSLLTLARYPGYGTFWDASGNDTVSAAFAPEGWIIFLPDDQPSSLVDTRVGLAVPRAESSSAPTALLWLAGTMENAVGSAFADEMHGSEDNNQLTGGGGDDYLDGGGGIDTAVFSGLPSQYTLERLDGYILIVGPDGSDALVGIERTQVGSFKIAVDIEGHGGQAYRLYQAAFNRTPDQGGLGYQMNALDQGMSLSQVAANFIASPEFQSTYGALNNAQFVTQLYANVLHRAPDAGGLAYHVDHLAHGFARADILVGFSESPENQAAVIGAITYGMFYT